MSMQSQIAPQAASLTATVPFAATVPGDNLPTLAWWALQIDVSLKIVRGALAAKLGAVDRGEIDAPRSKFEAALAECDAIEAHSAALAAPQPAAPRSILGHLVADLEAAVAHADREAKSPACRRTRRGLKNCMRIGDAGRAEQLP